MNKTRELELIRLYKILEPTLEIDRETKINNAKICNIAMGDAAYKRVSTWLRETIAKGKPKDDMTLARIEYQKSFELMKSRNSKYGDSWKVLTIQSLANLCEMKLHRIANMNVKELDPKIEDELRDTMNYMVFGLIKLNQQNAKN